MTATPLLSTPFGSYVDPADYSDHDLVVFVSHLDAWWSLLSDDNTTKGLSALRSRSDTSANALAASIGCSPATTADLVTKLTAHEKSRAFFPVRGPLERFARDTILLLVEAAAAVRSSRNHEGPPGSVASVNVSPGGVPKQPSESGFIGWRTLDGDRQGNRIHHGRPFQAVCLWSVEVIDALRREGHHPVAGAAGENITISGLEWAQLRCGDRLRIGEALVELTFPATPCTKIASLFSDRDQRRIDHDTHPGWSRLYGSVIETGHVRVGDRVIAEV